MLDDLLHHAWDLGIRTLDTSWNYGDGSSFPILRRWEENNHRYFRYILKVGRKKDNDSVYSLLSINKLLEEIQQIQANLSSFSLIDTILIKDPPSEILENGSILDLLQQLHDYYPSVHLGFSTHHLFECFQLPSIMQKYVVQLEYNAINMTTSWTLVHHLNQKGWRVVGMQPLAYGFLANKYNYHHIFGEDDWRKLLPHTVMKTYISLSHAFDRHFLKEQRQLSPAVKALAFCLSHANLDQLIIGAKSTEQLKDVQHALEWSQNEQFIAAYQDYIKRTIPSYLSDVSIKVIK